MSNQSTQIQEVEAGLYDLFKYCFITNCKLDDESITMEERKTLEELDSIEILQNFQQVVQNLLDFKKENHTSEVAYLSEQCKQLEQMVQKLEGDARNHDKIEQQLRMHIQALQQKVDEIERVQKYHQARAQELESTVRARELEKSSFQGSLNQKIKQLQEQYLCEIAKVTAQHRQKLFFDKPENQDDRRQLEDKLQRVKTIATKRQRQIEDLESRVIQRRSMLKQRTGEIDKLKEDYDRLYKQFIYLKDNKSEGRYSSIELLQKKLQEKSSLLSSLHKQLKSSIKSDRSPDRPASRQTGKRQSKNLRSMSDLEINNYERPRNDLASARPQSAAKLPGHARATSENYKFDRYAQMQFIVKNTSLQVLRLQFYVCSQAL